jgi:hypothetical protein
MLQTALALIPKEVLAARNDGEAQMPAVDPQAAREIRQPDFFPGHDGAEIQYIPGGDGLPEM